MEKNLCRTLLVFIACLGWLHGAKAQIRINEIMYHPATEKPAEEYVELQNLAATNVNVTGWRFTKGISFTFSNNIVIPAGGFLVVVANTNAFTAKYPAVANFVGDWVGGLDNSDETIRLENNLGTTVDEIFYADEGDYAVRVRGLPDYNHRGWDGRAEHDGRGKSLERINPLLTGQCGQNWAASGPSNGTP